MLRATIRRYCAAYAGLPREAWLLALVLLVNRAGTMVLPFLTLYLTSQLGMSEAAAGRMISVYGIGAICGAYLSGRLCDSIGPMRLQTICMLLSAPCYLLIGVWDTWPPLAASLFALSLVNEAVRPANATAITQLTTPENRTRAFALQRLAVNLGFSVGPAVGGVLATVNFQLLFIVDAATTLLAAAILLYVFRMRRFEAPAEHADQPLLRVSPLRDRTFVAFLGLTMATMMVFLQFGSTYPLYLSDHFHLGKPGIGLMFTINTLIIVAVEMLLLQALKGWPLVRTIGWGSFLACVGFGMLPFGDTTAYAILAMLVVTAGEMLSFSLAASFVASRGQRGSESLYLGWYVATHSLAWVIGPALGAAIYEVNPDATWYAGLGMSVFILAGYYALAWRMGDQPCSALDAPEVQAAVLTPLAEVPLEQLPQHGEPLAPHSLSKRPGPETIEAARTA
jgi:MFS family permease